MSRNRIIALGICLAVVCVLAYLFYKQRHPHAETGTTIVETDTTIVTTSVVETRDSSGNLQYETLRKVEYKK